MTDIFSKTAPCYLVLMAASCQVSSSDSLLQCSHGDGSSIRKENFHDPCQMHTAGKW